MQITDTARQPWSQGYGARYVCDVIHITPREIGRGPNCVGAGVFRAHGAVLTHTATKAAFDEMSPPVTPVNRNNLRNLSRVRNIRKVRVV